MCLRVILVAPIVLTLLSLPIEKAWDDSDFQDPYTEFPNFYWDDPRCARNSLDIKPGLETEEVESGGHQQTRSLSTKIRLLRPHQLVVLKDGQWVLEPKPAKRLAYMFISHTNEHFHTNTSDKNRESIEQTACVLTPH